MTATVLFAMAMTCGAPLPLPKKPTPSEVVPLKVEAGVVGDWQMVWGIDRSPVTFHANGRYYCDRDKDGRVFVGEYRMVGDVLRMDKAEYGPDVWGGKWEVVLRQDGTRWARVSGTSEPFELRKGN